MCLCAASTSTSAAAYSGAASQQCEALEAMRGELTASRSWLLAERMLVYAQVDSEV